MDCAVKVIFLTRRPSSVILDIQHMYRFDPGQFRGDFSMGIIVHQIFLHDDFTALRLFSMKMFGTRNDTGAF